MVAPSFYNQADQNIYNQGYSFIPQEMYRGAFTPKNLSFDEDSGIASLNIASPRTTGRQGEGGITNIGGNAFGYGSAVSPVSYGQYGAPGYMGGLPGGVQAVGIGRQFVGDELAMSPTGYNYSYKKEVPGVARIAASLIPFGNLAINAIEKKMNDGSRPSYGIAGLNDMQKGAYNQLAGQGLLFSGPSGMKTATGLNFGAKGYFDGQADIFNDLTDKGFSLNDEDDVVDGFGNIVTGFRALQYREALANQNYQKDLADKKAAAAAAQAAADKKAAGEFMKNNPNYGNQYDKSKDHSGDGGYGGSSKRSADNRSSDLGFSDIRLKENVELIGKSPSNINIYSFNYLNNPTKYQGVMAHEVPWASQKHDSGYLMVDYNKVDVDFKKDIDYNRKTLYKENLG